MIDPLGLPVDDFWSHSLGKSRLREVVVVALAIPPSVDTFRKAFNLGTANNKFPKAVASRCENRQSSL